MTNQIIELDVVKIDMLVKDYTGHQTFELITWLDNNPHIIMYTQSFPAGTTKAVTIFQANTLPKAQQLREYIIDVMRQVIGLLP